MRKKGRYIRRLNDKWKWFVRLHVRCISKVYISYTRYTFLFNMRKRRQQGSHKIFQYWKSRDVCKEIILLPSIGVSKLWFYHISSKYIHYPLQGEKNPLHSHTFHQTKHRTVLKEDWRSWYSPGFSSLLGAIKVFTAEIIKTLINWEKPKLKLLLSRQNNRDVC